MKNLLIVLAVIVFHNPRVPIASCLLGYENRGMKPLKAAKLCYQENKPQLRKVTKL